MRFFYSNNRSYNSLKICLSYLDYSDLINKENYLTNYFSQVDNTSN